MTEHPAQPQAHGVRIDAQPGHATISIDGTPLPPNTVTGYTLQHDIIGGIPLVVLHTRQPDGAAFEGLARVAVGVAESPADIAAGFLDQIDPAELENAALNRDDLGTDKYDLTRAMLRQLTDWARGQQ
jgi:hypothetical protein